MQFYGAVLVREGRDRWQPHRRRRRDGCVGLSLRGDVAAQMIQFAIEYVPKPIFHSGTPGTAPAEVHERFQKENEPIGREREAESFLHVEKE